MEEPLTIPLIKHTTPNTKTRTIMGAGSKFFKLMLTDEIINHLGKQVKVSLRLNDAKFPCIVIEKFGQISHGTPSIISGKTLRIPAKLVDEWSDLGDYNVEFGNECIVLTKK